mgnify:CR=1 FL=1
MKSTSSLLPRVFFGQRIQFMSVSSFLLFIDEGGEYRKGWLNENFLSGFMPDLGSSVTDDGIVALASAGCGHSLTYVNFFCE